MSTFEEIALKLFHSDSSSSLILTEREDASPEIYSSDYQDNNKRTSKFSKGISKSGFCYALVAGLFFCALSASVKYLEDLDPGLVAFYQYAAIAVFSLPMVVRNDEHLLGPEKFTKYWLLLCGIFDAFTVYFCFLAFKNLPLSDASVLTCTVPVFVTITARIFLKEKCGAFQILAIAVSVIGIALVSKIPFMWMDRTHVFTRENVIGILASFGSITSESSVYIVLRKLHDVNVFIVLFNFGIVAAVVNVMLTFAAGSFTLTTCGIQQWVVVGVGVFSFLSQLALTRALELEEAGPVAVVMAAGDVIPAFLIDMTFFNNTPDIFMIFGTLLVVSSVMLVGFNKWLEENVKCNIMKIKL